MVFNFIGSKCKKNRTRKQVKCDNNNSNNKILKGKKNAQCSQPLLGFLGI